MHSFNKVLTLTSMVKPEDKPGMEQLSTISGKYELAINTLVITMLLQLQFLNPFTETHVLSRIHVFSPFSCLPSNRAEDSNYEVNANACQRILQCVQKLMMYTCGKQG